MMIDELPDITFEFEKSLMDNKGIPNADGTMDDQPQVCIKINSVQLSINIVHLILVILSYKYHM